MNKKLLIVAIAVLLICVGLSGCTDDINITPKNIDGDPINQQNIELGGGQGYIIGYQGSNPRNYAQSFKPTKEVLTRVELYLRRGTGEWYPDEPLNFYIRSSIDGANLRSMTKTANDISDSFAWIEFDFTDLSVTPDEEYFIVLTNDDPSGCYYEWQNTIDLYSRGSAWMYWGGYWDEIIYNEDDTEDTNFITHGLKGIDLE